MARPEARVVEVRDAEGRTLAIRELTALDHLRLLKAAGPELAHNDAWLDMAGLVFALVEVDGRPRPIPTSEHQIEAGVRELGTSGLRAIADGLRDFEKARP